jgi:hypothetical protein
MKSERIRDNLFVYRCSDCSAPLFTTNIPIASWPVDRETLCFNCLEDRCEVSTFFNASHLHTRDVIDDIINSDNNEMHKWAGPQAVKEVLRYYKQKLRAQKTAEAEADIDDIF